MAGARRQLYFSNAFQVKFRPVQWFLQLLLLQTISGCGMRVGCTILGHNTGTTEMFQKAMPQHELEFHTPGAVPPHAAVAGSTEHQLRLKDVLMGRQARMLLSSASRHLLQPLPLPRLAAAITSLPIKPLAIKPLAISPLPLPLPLSATKPLPLPVLSLKPRKSSSNIYSAEALDGASSIDADASASTTDTASVGTSSKASNDEASAALPAVPSATYTVAEQQKNGFIQQSANGDTSAATDTFRIVGGVPVDMFRYPYIASLRTNAGDHYCGGTLIAPSVVLTGAHCVAMNPSLSLPEVHIGRYLSQDFDGLPGFVQTMQKVEYFATVQSVPHPGWTLPANVHDIALLYLNGSASVTPVKIPEVNSGDMGIQNGASVVVLGYGSRLEGAPNSVRLQEVQLSVSDLTECNSTFHGRLKSSQLCAGDSTGGKDACQGDSGGPLIVKGGSASEDVQLGVVSFGIGCGRPGIPGVYTDVRKYRFWIYEQLMKSNRIPSDMLEQLQVWAASMAMGSQTNSSSATAPFPAEREQPAGSSADAQTLIVEAASSDRVPGADVSSIVVRATARSDAARAGVPVVRGAGRTTAQQVTTTEPRWTTASATGGGR